MPPNALRSGSVTIRSATAADIHEIAAIYSHHVLYSTATFEETPPEEAEMARRMRNIQENGFPWLVAEASGEVIGYAYAGPYNPRPGYRYTVEDSIYLAPAHTGRGIGSRLLGELIAACEAENRFVRMIAIIGDRANAGSIALHRKHGFDIFGVAERTGFKFGRFLDLVFMAKTLRHDPKALPRD